MPLRLLLLGLAAVSLSAQPSRDAIFAQTLAYPTTVRGGWIDAHWMQDGRSFWYAEGARNDWTFYKYDPMHGARTPLVDAARVRAALAKIAGNELPGSGLPFNTLVLLPGERSARVAFRNRSYILALDSYTLRTETDAEHDLHQPRLLSKPAIVGPPPVYEIPSPDGRWFLGAKDHNLYLRSATDGHIDALTSDGIKDYSWDFEWSRLPLWSPDSRAIALRRTDQRNRPEALYPLVHWLKPTLDVEWIPLNQKPAVEGYILDVASRKLIRIPDDAFHIRAWRPDGSELLITRTQKQTTDLLAVNAKTGAARPLFTETTQTFFDMLLTMPNSSNFVMLGDNRRFLWLSERDGWNEVYLYDIEGTLLRQLTSDRHPVERIVTVDEKSGWVYYTAHGGENRPYDFQLYRVSLNGGRSARLTDAPGQHDLPLYVSYQGARGEGIQFAPSGEFFLDAHSDLNRPPQTDLRRADGSLVAVLAQTSMNAVIPVMPHSPEEFTVKAADGQTDLYGVLYKPRDFDPKKKYPVVDFIYAGPQMTRVPRTFTASAREQAYANLGLILIVLDARGTPARGKAFQDVAYKNLGRHEIPDHAAALQQLAAARPYLDLTRVAALGGSTGGYFAVRALLQAPEVFQVGIALAPIYDFREVNNVLWMGAPEENKAAYDFASNLSLAAKLQGHLLIIHGTSDVNAPFANTMLMLDALERANKPYDLVLLPELDHNGQNSPYSLQAIKRYLIEHLKL
jgi:dipeptidyl aminopeptidase/acylaminoacyl peptidase